MQASEDSSSGVATNINGPIAILRFTRPSQRNPLSRQILNDLDAALTTIFARADLSAIVFTGSEGVFASGANVRELIDLDQAEAQEFSRSGQSLFQRIANAKQITIAAINGFCMGGALDLALACDIRVASSDAVFSHPGARLGIVTGWGGTQRLPRLVGRARALEFLLTAQRYSAAEALKMGLVTRVADPVLACAMDVARGFGKS